MQKINVNLYSTNETVTIWRQSRYMYFVINLSIMILENNQIIVEPRGEHKHKQKAERRSRLGPDKKHWPFLEKDSPFLCEEGLVAPEAPEPYAYVYCFPYSIYGDNSC